MYKKIAVSLFTLIAFATASASNVRGQQRSDNPPASVSSSVPARDPLTMLPASDVIIDLNVRRVLTEALPRLLAKSPAKLAEMNHSLGKLKIMTGIDIRAIERIVIGGRVPVGGLVPTSTTTMPDGVVIVQGEFNIERLESLAGLASEGRVVQQNHNGVSVRTWTFKDQAQQAGMMLPAIREISTAMVDQQTLVAGTPTVVRECLDIYQASGGRSEVNSELIGLATQNPAALIAVGIKMKPGAASNTDARSPATSRRGLQLDEMDKFGTASPAGSTTANAAATDQFTKVLESIDHIHASIGMTALGLDALLITRTKTFEQAEEINTMIAGLRQMIESGITKSSSTRSPFSNLDISLNGNEVRISMQMTQNEMTSLMAAASTTRSKASAVTPRARRSRKAGVRR